MKYSKRDIIEYIVMIVSDFASKYNLTESEAFRYLSFHKGIGFLENNYGIMHTLDFEDALNSVALYCKKTGGEL